MELICQLLTTASSRLDGSSYQATMNIHFAHLQLWHAKAQLPPRLRFKIQVQSLVDEYAQAALTTCRLGYVLHAMMLQCSRLQQGMTIQGLPDGAVTCIF